MSLRCVGAQNARTAPNGVLNGATTVSISFWVLINPGSGVPSSDALLLGKTNGDPVSISIVGGTASTVRMNWYASNAGVETGSSCDVVLTGGMATHLVMTYAPGQQRYFVNGVLVATDTCASPLGRPIDNLAPQFFQVGPDVAGLDVTLDEPTIWQGYALSQSDVDQIRDRIVHPEGIAASQIVWQLTLSGTDGAPAAVGNPGLADLGSSNQAVTTISTPAPAFVGGVLTYAPAVVLSSVKLGPSNQTIICNFKGGDGSFSPVVSVTSAVLNTVQVSGASGTFELTVNGQTTAPITIGANPGTVQAAVAALPGIGSGNVQVQGVSPYLISAAGTLVGQPVTISGNVSGLSSTFASVPGPDTAPGSGAAVTILNTDSACVFAGNWTRTNGAGPSNSGATYKSDLPGPLTPCSATYTFSGIAPGTYLIQATWPVYSTNASAAPYRIYDGTTFRALARVDQRAIPGIQGYNNFNRRTIGQVYCGSGTIVVIVANDADAPVFADAVILTPVTSLAPYAINSDSANPYHLFSGDCVFSGSAWQLSGLNTSDFGYQHHSAPPGTGSNTVTWRQPLLAAGSYDIQATWPSNSGNASNASYNIYDGSTLVGTVTIDQRSAPAGGITDSSSGPSVTFQSLGTFTISSGTASVVLSDNANAYVNANAILFRPVGSTLQIGTPPVQAPVPVTLSVQSYGGLPTISINGGPPVSLTLPALNSNYIFYPLTSPVPAGATVTFSAPPNWALTSAGAVPAFSGYPVTTGLKSLLPPFNATSPKTMQAGYVLPGVGYASPVLVYADLMKQASDWIAVNGAPFTVDADGWPLTTGPNGIFAIVTQTMPNFIDNAGMPNAPFGAYTVVWDAPDGTGQAWLSTSGGDSYTEDTSRQANLSSTTGRTRVFEFVSNPTSVSPSITVCASGLCKNIRVYPPGAATDGSQLFHPQYLQMLEGTGNLRTETFVQINPGTVVDYADFPTTTQRSCAQTAQWPSFTIASVTPGSGNYGFFNAGRPTLVVTTTAPHNLKTGHIITFFTNPGGVVVTFASSETNDLNLFTPTVYVLSPTSFVVSVSNASTITSVALNSPGPIRRPSYGSPPEHAVALVNAVPGATLHLNVPQAISNAAATTLFQMVAANLAVGHLCRVELSNEPWNFAFPYEQFNFFEYLGVQRGLTNTQAYVQRASEIQAIARAAFAAVGRPNDVISVFNSIRLQSNVNAILSYAAAPTDPNAGGNPIRVDELAIAPYFQNGPLTYGSEYNFLTLDQVADAAELYLPGQSAGSFQQLRSWLDAAGFPATRMISYETGPALMYLGGDDPHKVYQSQGGVNHPRMYGLTLAMLQESQDAGCSVFTRNSVANDLHNDQSPNGVGVYGTYYAWNMPGGIGDGSDGGLDNRPALAAAVPGSKAFDYRSMCSPVGGAINRWNQLRMNPVKSAPKKPVPTRAEGPRPSRGRSR
jgi:hypothetical protein